MLDYYQRIEDLYVFDGILKMSTVLKRHCLSYHLSALMKLLAVVYSLTLLIGCSTQQCKRTSKIQDTNGADFVIGGLFPVHRGMTDPSNCTYNRRGAIWAEAMVFTVKEINANDQLLPNITLGYILYDSYNRVDAATEAILDIILSGNVTLTCRMNSTNPNGCKSSYPSLGRQCHCTSPSPSIIAVIGPSTSAVSTKISPLLSVYSIPQISYSATSIILSDKKRYPSFLRTAPSDSFQTRIIVDVLQHFNWTYVNVLASDDAYGRLGIDNLLAELKTKQICVGVMEVFSLQIKQSKTDKIIDKLKKENNTKVTVLWSLQKPAILLLQRASFKKLFHMTWIASDSLAISENLLKLPPSLVAGLIGIIPPGIHPRAYTDHLTHTHSDKRFTSDFFQIDLNTTFQNSDAKETDLNYVSNVIDAVYAVAYGLHSLLKSQGLLGEKLQNFHVVPASLLRHVKSGTFVAQSGQNFSFNDDGEPVSGAYSLTNIQYIDKCGLKFQTIGSWNSTGRKIVLRKDVKIHWAGNRDEVPISKCAEICPPGQYAFRQGNKECCWVCAKCPQGKFKPNYGTDECKFCPENSVPTTNSTRCVKLQEVFIEPITFHGIFLALSSFFGIIFSAFTISVFVKFRNTQTVRSSNRNLSLFQLSVVALIFLLPLLFIGRPTLPVCYLQPFLFGVLETISTSIIFTKTDRLLRIFKMKNRVTQGCLLSTNKIPFGIILTLVMIQLMGTVLYCFMSPPVVSNAIETHSFKKVIHCENGNILIGLTLYIQVIAVICTIYAFRARKLPSIYGDVKYIGFTMFTQSFIWALCSAIYFSSSQPDIRSFIYSLAILVTNYVILLVMYGPKMWKVSVHPERNNTMTFRSKISSQLRLSSGTLQLDLRERVVPDAIEQTEQ